MELLKQGLHSPLRVEQQIAVIYSGTKGLLKAIPTDKAREFETEYLKLLELEYQNELKQLAAGVFTDEIGKTLELAARTIVLKYIDKPKEAVEN